MVLAAGSFNHHSQVHMRRTIQIESNINSFELVLQKLSMSIGINIYSVCTNAEPYIHICIEFTAKLKFLENSNLIKANVRANLQLFT